MKINKISGALFFFSLCLFIFTGCNKKEKHQTVINPQHIEIVTDHQWYSFTSNDFVKIDKPQNAKSLSYVPWTEAVRISSANNATDDEFGNKAFGIVNRLGVLTFEKDKVTLSKDITLFPERTAGNLIFIDDVPVFSVYKSAFFNNSITNPVYKNDGNQHLFLVQFDSSAGISYPIINCNNIVAETTSEIVDYSWDGFNFLCCVKALIDGKTDFSYVKFHPQIPLLSISPVNASESVVVTETDVNQFRNSKAQLDYKQAPERVQKLLEGFSGKIPFVLEIKSAGGSSSKIYYNQIQNAKAKELNAKAIISKSWSAALFEDGTMFIEGALPGKHIIRSGKAVAIRLPKLPGGYVYSDFVIAGTTLYAAWEQTSFYKTSCSGFISVDLDATLYSKVK